MRYGDEVMKRIVMFSGGAGSWGAAKRIAEWHGTDDLVLLFADMLMEDEDLYRFLEEAAQDVGGELIKIAEGRDPWQVFFDRKYLGNTRVDPCSYVLKRKFIRNWLEENYAPDECEVYLGIDIDEEHRFHRAVSYWEPYTVRAPLIEDEPVFRHDVKAMMKEAGIEEPRLYKMGFPHNNCGGFCIKAGMSHFANLLRHLPDRYAYHEQKEQELREYLGKDVAILRDRTGGEIKPMTMRDLREKIESQPQQIPLFDWGGCGCFSGEE